MTGPSVAPWGPPLNEGRGRDPGDTWCGFSRPTIHSTAQRRPGSRPRRHKKLVQIQSPFFTAQRRPGSRPRRHSRRQPPDRRYVGSLNEGRGRDPGDTTSFKGDRGESVQAQSRSTKAGVETPATHARTRVALLPGPVCNRSTKAGVETPATRTGLRPMRVTAGRRVRSTKAGVETPATLLLADLIDRCGAEAALNEGRGRDPGDTPDRGPGHKMPLTSLAQRRPGSRPRRHTTVRDPASEAVLDSSTLNEGRGRDPGDTILLRRGGLSPCLKLTCAQRRPGSRPRRHTGPRRG